MARLEIHKYAMGNRTVVLDVNRSSVFEVDSLISDIFDLCEHLDIEDIINKLFEKYPAYDKVYIREALQKAKALQSVGYFKVSNGDNYPPDPDKQSINLVSLDTNTRCNLRCRYCCTGRGAGSVKGPTRSMPLPQVLRVVDRCLEMFGNIHDVSSPLVFCFSFTGEPLMSLDLFQQVKMYVDHQALTTGQAYHCSLANTNGTLLTSETAKFLSAILRHEISEGELVISLDGPQHIHDAMRVFCNGKGSYDRILPLAQHFMTLWPASVSAVVSGTQPFIIEIFSHLFSIGFRTIHMKPVRLPSTHPNALNNQTITTVKAEYSRFVEWLLEHDDQQLLWYLNSLHWADFFKRFLGRLIMQAKLSYRCGAARVEIAIDAQGDIYPCDSFVGIKAFKLGNIFQDGLDQQQRKKWFRLSVDQKPVCKDCWARYLCGGGCYHSALLATGQIETPDPVKCKLIKHLIELAMILLAELNRRNTKLLAAVSSTILFRPTPDPLPTAICSFVAKVYPLDVNDPTWQQAVPLRLDHENQIRGATLWRGPADLSGEVRLLWNTTYLYLLIKVVDDRYEPPVSIGRLILGDSVQIAIVPAVEGPAYEYGMAQIEHQPVFVRTNVPISVPLGPVPGAMIRIEQRGDRTLYCAAIPWTEWPDVQPTSGMELGFNVLLNECDHPDQPRAWMEWTPGMVIEKNHKLFGRVYLESIRKPARSTPEEVFG